MKSKAILVFLTAILAITALAVFASATVNPATNDLSVSVAATVNGVEVTTSAINLAEETGVTIPVRVDVTNFGTSTIDDAKVKVELADSEATTGLFYIEAGNTVTKTLALKLPSSLKDDISSVYTLTITVKTTDGEESVFNYDLKVQRASYDLSILSVDFTKSVQAGSTFNVDVVVKNRGAHEAQDTFVTVSIPSLDIEKKVYLNDLTPNDNCTDDCGKQDSAEGIISLKIPSDAKAGVYDMQIEASNDDSSDTMTKKVTIQGLEQGSDILVPVAAKDVASGQSVTYDLLIVNSGNRIAVYNIVPESAQNLIISVDEPIVTVPADSSRVVKITAQAGNVMGTFNFAVDVNSQGQLVKRVNLVANVGKAGITGNSNVIILTIVLAIIFIVLLVVLIVLLTRKPAKSEEFEESYY